MKRLGGKQDLEAVEIVINNLTDEAKFCLSREVSKGRYINMDRAETILDR